MYWNGSTKSGIQQSGARSQGSPGVRSLLRKAAAGGSGLTSTSSPISASCCLTACAIASAMGSVVRVEDGLAAAQVATGKRLARSRFGRSSG